MPLFLERRSDKLTEVSKNLIKSPVLQQSWSFLDSGHNSEVILPSFPSSLLIIGSINKIQALFTPSGDIHTQAKCMWNRSIAC